MCESNFNCNEKSDFSTIDGVIRSFEKHISCGNKKVFDARHRDMTNAKSAEDALEIARIYEDFHFHRFSDNNEIVATIDNLKRHCGYKVGDEWHYNEEDIYFDAELAKPYIDKHIDASAL